MNTPFTFTREHLQAGHAKEMSKIAKEKVEARLYEDGDLTLFGSEIAMLRIAYANRNRETKVMYSENLKTWFCSIYEYAKPKIS